MADAAALAKLVTARAASLGFDAIGFAPARLPAETRARLDGWLADGRHGTMGWMATRADARGAPDTLWPEAVTAISLGLSYAPAGDPLAVHALRDRGAISVYAQGRDYHDVIKGLLKQLAGFILARAQRDADVKVFVDTAPLMEKPLAAQAGLGWQGKHTNLVSRAHGSWLFLGEILTTLAFPPSAPATGNCGTCTRCIAACPTDAIPAPFQLDARRCISYLTIEHAGQIPLALRPLLGNRIYGCDDCLAVCPWNRFAQASRNIKLASRPDLRAPTLEALSALDNPSFRALFSQSPVKRIGRDRFVRNVLYAIGNSGDPTLREPARARFADADPAVADAARWAVTMLSPDARAA